MDRYRIVEVLNSSPKVVIQRYQKRRFRKGKWVAFVCGWTQRDGIVYSTGKFTDVADAENYLYTFHLKGRDVVKIGQYYEAIHQQIDWGTGPR